MTEQTCTPYVLDYDYRGDGGPRLVGPFATAADATAHADTLRGPGWSASYVVWPLTPSTPAPRADLTDAPTTGDVAR